jgi:hypothetical protein
MLSSKHLLFISFGLACATLLCPSLAATPPQDAQSEIPTAKLVSTLRLLNTEEYSYRGEHGRFANWEELLGFLRQNGYKRNAVIDFENPKPYELEITTSKDGEHYQITLKRTSDMNDKSTWCKTAVFSDDAGVISLGAALDCEAPTH